MKKVKKFIALLVAVCLISVSFLTVSAADYAALKITDKQYFATGAGVSSKIPQLDGMGDLNKKIEDSVFAFASKNNSYFFDPYENIVIKYTAADNEENARFATVNVVISLYTDAAGLGKSDTTYYIDKEGNKELADKAAYDAAIKTAADEAAAAEEEAKEEDGEEADDGEDAALSDEQLAELVPLRKWAEFLGYELVWNGELGAIEIVGLEKEIVILVDDAVCVVGDDETYPVAIGRDEEGSVLVPVSFFMVVLEATPVYVLETEAEDGTITSEEVKADTEGAVFKEFAKAAAEEVTE